MPAAAKEHTDRGAEAFVRYFDDVLNAVGARPKAGVLSALALPTCKTCARHETTISSLASKSQRFDGDQFHVLRTYKDATGAFVNVVDSPSVNIVDAQGETVERFESEPTRGRVFQVKWDGAGWKVAKIFSDVTVQS